MVDSGSGFCPQIGGETFIQWNGGSPFGPPVQPSTLDAEPSPCLGCARLQGAGTAGDSPNFTRSAPAKVSAYTGPIEHHPGHAIAHIEEDHHCGGRRGGGPNPQGQDTSWPSRPRLVGRNSGCASAGVVRFAVLDSGAATIVATLPLPAFSVRDRAPAIGTSRRTSPALPERQRRSTRIHPLRSLAGGIIA